MSGFDFTAMPMDSKLQNAFQFLSDIDRAKTVLRQNVVPPDLRRENDAEHSWHMAVCAMILAPYYPHPLDLSRCLSMILLHDVVEIDAGDTYCYDELANLDKADRECCAAERIFGLLGPEGAKWEALWKEFEAGESHEAKFAAIMDRIQPLLMHMRTDGCAWKTHGISREQVEKRNEAAKEQAPALWEAVTAMLDYGQSQGWLK